MLNVKGRGSVEIHAIPMHLSDSVPLSMRLPCVFPELEIAIPRCWVIVLVDIAPDGNCAQVSEEETTTIAHPDVIFRSHVLGSIFRKKRKRLCHEKK